ncbi:MAG: hypothetical protein HY812_18760 [Planctomycetes bacterium]|nr:hypothetical protein [Planctomycetota bacterium]
MTRRPLALLIVLGVLSAPVLQAGEDRAANLFLPAFEYRNRPVSEWLDVFLRSHGNDSGALFCVFYWDDRSEPVLEALKGRLSSPRTSREAKRNIEAVLNHWQVEYEAPPEPPPAPWQTHPGAFYPLPDEAFTPPLPLLEGDDDALLALLREDGDPKQRVRAAVTLVWRQRHVEEVVPLLVRALFEQTGGSWRLWWQYAEDSGSPETRALAHALIFCIEFAGSAADQALAKMLGDQGTVEPLRLFVLRRLGTSSVALPELYTPVLADLAARPGETGQMALAWALVLGLGWLYAPYVAAFLEEADSWDLLDLPLGWAWIHSGAECLGEREGFALSLSGREDQASPEAAALMARAVAAFLGAARQDAVAFDPQDAWLFFEPGRRDESVRKEVIAGLLPFLDRDGDDVLRVLCALGAEQPAVRECYLRVLEGWSDFSADGIERVPCLKHHDEETLAALTAVFERTEEKWPFLWATAAAGLLDDPESEVGQRTLAALDQLPPERWHDVYMMGCCLVPEVHPTDDPIVQVNKLALAIRTQQQRGEDAQEHIAKLLALLSQNDEPPGWCGPWDEFVVGPIRVAELGIATPEFLDWAVDFLLDDMSYHRDYVANMVAHFPLNRRQQAILCQADHYFGGIADYVPALAAQGQASLERVGRIRELMQADFPGPFDCTRRIDFDILEAVLDITRPTAAERGILARAITGGIAKDRARALAMVAEHGLDAPEIVAAVTEALQDCDATVRRAAQGALRALGR